MSLIGPWSFYILFCIRWFLLFKLSLEASRSVAASKPYNELSKIETFRIINKIAYNHNQPLAKLPKTFNWSKNCAVRLSENFRKTYFYTCIVLLFSKEYMWCPFGRVTKSRLGKWRELWIWKEIVRIRA